MNSVNLTGRIANDLEIRKTNANLSILDLRVAVQRRKKEDGADFISVTCFGQSADYLVSYAKKGTMIEVNGRITTNNYTKENGEKVYKTFVTAESVSIIAQPKESQSQTIERTQDNFGGGYEGIKQDDLPFY